MDGKLTQKESSNFVGFSQKRKEHVTPYKIAVVCLINQMCILRYKIRPNAYLCKGERGITIKPQHLRDFYLLTLKLIHCPDLAFTELHKLLTGKQYQLMPELLANYEKLCDKILVKKIDGLMDTINNLNKMLIDLPGQMSPLVNKSSPVGLFLRRMMLHFDKLSFPQTILVFEAFERYVREGREQVEKDKGFVVDRILTLRENVNTSTPESANTGSGSVSKNQMDITSEKMDDDEMDISEEEKTAGDDGEGIFKQPTAINTPYTSKVNFDKTLPLLSQLTIGQDTKKVEKWDPGAIWSRKQAELFISQQAMFLLNNPQQALPPPVLQERLQQILKHNPEHAEAYYLSYLNCLRVNEFCGALENLYHYFDRSNTLLNHEDKPKGLRFAALNLGILYAHFGHKEEALRALREAIALAHEVSDNQCLQHIQAWYYKLIGNEKIMEKQMERSILKSSDLNLHFLTSFGLLSFSRFASSMGTKPSLVFELLHKSDLLNFHYDITDLMANSYATKAGLWNMYGKTEMASLMSQMLLHLDLKDPTIGLTCYNGESVCLAICNVTSRFIEEGEFHLANIVLNHAKERFPQEKSWQLVEQLLVFTQALYQRQWLEAQRAVDQIAAHDKIESKLRRAELLIERENFREAMETVNSLFESENERMGALHRTRALILPGKATMCESNKCDRMPMIRKYGHEKPVDRSACTGSAAVNHFMKAVTTGSEFYLNYYSCMATIEHAKLLYDKGFTNQALRLMEEGIVTVLAHGTSYDQASALYFYLVCEANSIQETNGPMRVDAIMEIVKTLERVKDTFKRLGVVHKIQSIVFLQAMLCEDVGKTSELYKYSLEFRKLDELNNGC
ncbi:anaphase-promoting complex subunit 5 [Diaphorina citri]|uniref:Anaphase-promoting complex subunit 5 n=1 Tax=Diaphorina citri TaxID=121845 RepID=A0A3Q0IWE6_DIACI|nr:anaphase-promoting complex subunit 5 [Diaphorina citri]XP_026680581.1 anaphase-promoting complex subunit 5 [Diaphorina citri]